jgi:shikimate 5-dehydrogenase
MSKEVSHHFNCNVCTALILGAGGTARAAVYAVHAMGFASILIWNRTLERAESVAAELNGVCGNVSAVSELGQV